MDFSEFVSDASAIDLSCLDVVEDFWWASLGATGVNKSSSFDGIARGDGLLGTNLPLDFPVFILVILVNGQT